MSSRVSAIVDLLAILALLGAAVGVVFGTALDGPLRVAAVLPTILFVPGYALVSALYPDHHAAPEDRGESDRSLNPLERAGLAVVASVAIVPLVALVANFTIYGVRARPVLAGTAAVTVLLTVVALVRRFLLDPSRRFHVSAGWVGASARRYLTSDQPSLDRPAAFEARTSGQRLLNLLLVGAVLVLLSSVAYAAVGPNLSSQDGTYTELSLLDGDGERLLGSGETAPTDGTVPFVVAVTNEEDRETTYTVVFVREQVRTGENRTVVRNRSVFDSVTTTVADGETARLSKTVQGGEGERIRVLLYRGEAPANPTGADAYRTARFWPAGNPN